MDRKKIEPADADWWESSHAGFDFDNEWQAADGDNLSAVMRKDELNQFELLRCDGLDEVVENRNSQEILPSNVSQGKNEKYASQLAKNFNPFIISQKKQKQNIRYGPEETVRNMILGLEYSLSVYKGKRQKVELLNAAVKSHDGNAILEIILYMKDTLKKSIFQREIVQCPDAVNVYLAYLEEDHEIDELTNMLLLLKRAEDAAILKYQAAIIVQDAETKRKWVENCFSTHFQMEASDSFLRQSVAEHVQLLREYVSSQLYHPSIPANETDKNLLLFEYLTGNKSVIDSSVLSSLIFCCLYYHTGGEITLRAAEMLKNNFKLSQKQYTWAAVKALAALERWTDIDYLFISKNWMGGMKVRSPIAFSRILEMLSKAKAPTEVLKKYVSFVENDEDKLTLAKKYACHSVVIEVYKNNKDRTALKNYLSLLIPNSADFYLAKEILNNSAIRWKN